MPTSLADLRAKIEARVQLAQTTIELGEREFTWHRVADPDQLLEAAVQEDVELSPAELDPFWAATWRAAVGLDRFLARLDLRGTRVLELGCGSGQAGVGAAARGAQVLLTDVVELALLVAELNAWPVRENVAFQRLNWDGERIAAPAFPVIIGSDLVYDPSLFPLLDQCARNHLASGGQMYLSEPHRHTGNKFSGWIRDAGWETQEHDVDLHDSRVPIRVFVCTLPE